MLQFCLGIKGLVVVVVVVVNVAVLIEFKNSTRCKRSASILKTYHT
jgi:hypothetical protein